MPPALGVLLGGAHGIARLIPGQPLGLELSADELDGAPVTSLDAAAQGGRGARRPGVRAIAGSPAGVWVRQGSGRWRRSVETPAHCVRVGPGGLLLAGVEPAAVISSDDGGESWQGRPGLGAALRHAPSLLRPSGRPLAVRGLCFAGDGWLAGVDGAGAWLSHDGGWSWLRSADGLPDEVCGVWEHPEQPECAYAATRAGFFRSQDGGASWVQSLGGLDRTLIGDAAVLPGVSDVILLAAARRPRSDGEGSEAALFRSADGAISWRRVALGDADSWPAPPAVCRLHGLSDTAFVSAGGRLWASHDRGGQWRMLADGVPESLALAAVL